MDPWQHQMHDSQRPHEAKVILWSGKVLPNFTKQIPSNDCIITPPAAPHYGHHHRSSSNIQQLNATLPAKSSHASLAISFA
jgi:hypothetical protein